MRLWLLFLLLLLPLRLAAEQIDGQVEWRGTRRILETVRVAEGAELSIAAGSRLEFIDAGLEVAGTLNAAQVDFVGENWPGLTLERVDERTRLSDCRIQGAQIGIKVLGGQPQLQRLQLADNEVGIELRQQSRAQLSESLVTESRKVGLFVKDGSTPQITGNRFVANPKFAVYLFRSVPETFYNNRFEENDTGLMIAYFGSDPLIEGNLFRNNRVGIEVDRSAKPQLRRNRLQQNRTAIQLQRRADAVLEGNLLEGNQLGLLVRFSSYPRINGNDFVDNRLAVKLEHQSSVWEQVNGQQRRQQAAAARGAFGARPRQQVGEEQRRPKELNGRVDLRGNWFGAEAAAEIERLGADANLSFIFDSHDRPTFEEAGREYPLDRVDYYPAARQPQFQGML